MYSYATAPLILGLEIAVVRFLKMYLMRLSLSSDAAMPSVALSSSEQNSNSALVRITSLGVAELETSWQSHDIQGRQETATTCAW
jgi:hypothetical protein